MKDHCLHVIVLTFHRGRVHLMRVSAERRSAGRPRRPWPRTFSCPLPSTVWTICRICVAGTQIRSGLLRLLLQIVTAVIGLFAMFVSQHVSFGTFNCYIRCRSKCTEKTRAVQTGGQNSHVCCNHICCNLTSPRLVAATVATYCPSRTVWRQIAANGPFAEIIWRGFWPPVRPTCVVCSILEKTYVWQKTRLWGSNKEDAKNTEDLPDRGLRFLSGYHWYPSSLAVCSSCPGRLAETPWPDRGTASP